MIRANGETDMGQEKSKILANKGEPLTTFLSPDTGGVDTCLHHSHPPTCLDVLPPHPLAHQASSQGSGSLKGRGDNRLGPHRSHRPRGPRPVRLRHPRLCSGSTGRGGGGGKRGIAFPCPVWTNGEGYDTFPPAPPLRVRGGSGCGPPPPFGSRSPGDEAIWKGSPP